MSRKNALKSFGLIPLLLLVGLPALAADGVVDLKKGEPAPFAGMLYPIDLAINIGRKAERCTFLLDQNAKYAQQKFDVEKDLCTQRMRLNRETYRLQLSTLRRAKEVPASPWVIGLSYVAGAATVAIGAWVAATVGR